MLVTPSKLQIVLYNMSKRQTKDIVNNLLLLGTGGSGKSTIFRQIREIYGEPLAVMRERYEYARDIQHQCIAQMKHALYVLGDFLDENNANHDSVAKNYQLYVRDGEKDDGDFGIPDLSEKEMETLTEYGDYIDSFDLTKSRLNNDAVAALKSLWSITFIRLTKCINGH